MTREEATAIKECIRKSAYSIDSALWAVTDAARAYRKAWEAARVEARIKNAYVCEPADVDVLGQKLDAALDALDVEQSRLVREVSVAYREGDLTAVMVRS